MKPKALASTRGRARASWLGSVVCTLATVAVMSCAAAGPDSESDADLPFASEMSEALFGTESGNPTTPELELGTESGNPIGEAIPDTESGTESGNPTRPPPAPVVGPETAIPEAIEPEPAAPVVEVPEEPTDVAAPDPTEAQPDATPDDGVNGPAPTEGNPGTAPMGTAPVGSPEPPASAAGCDPAQCQLTANQFAAAVGTAQPAPTPFEQFTCTESGSCLCESPAQTVEIVPAESGCLVPGTWSCLVDAVDFQGCDEATPMACESACAQLDDARVADGVGRAVEVRASACVVDQCRFVLTVEGECFAGGGAVLTLDPADCSLTDDELLAP